MGVKITRCSFKIKIFILRLNTVYYYLLYWNIQIIYFIFRFLSLLCHFDYKMGHRSTQISQKYIFV